MAHIQDLIEKFDPCLIIISKQCSFPSDPSTLVESHPSILTCISSAIHCHSSCWDLLSLPWLLRHREGRDHLKGRGLKRGKEEVNVPIHPSSMMIWQWQKAKFLFLQFLECMIPLSITLLIPHSLFLLLVRVMWHQMSSMHLTRMGLKVSREIGESGGI